MMRTCFVLLLAGCAPAAAPPLASPSVALPVARCSPQVAPAADGGRATRADSGSVVPLRTVPSADSVVARRAGATILLSAADVDAYLTDFLQRHRHLADDRALLERVRRATRQAGWAELAADSGQDRMREDFLLAALLERGQAAVRDRSGTTVRQVCLHRVGTDNWWGRRIVLPDGSTLLEVVDVVI